MELTPEERRKRNMRNWAIAAALLAFVVLVYAVTIVKIAGNVAERSL